MDDDEPSGRDTSPWVPDQDRPPFSKRLKTILFGPPRDLADTRIFHRLSAVAFLAWVDAGADGLRKAFCAGVATLGFGETPLFLVHVCSLGSGAHTGMRAVSKSPAGADARLKGIP